MTSTPQEIKNINKDHNLKINVYKCWYFRLALERLLGQKTQVYEPRNRNGLWNREKIYPCQRSLEKHGSSWVLMLGEENSRIFFHICRFVIQRLLPYKSFRCEEIYQPTIWWLRYFLSYTIKLVIISFSFIFKSDFVAFFTN